MERVGRRKKGTRKDQGAETVLAAGINIETETAMEIVKETVTVIAIETAKEVVTAIKTVTEIETVIDIMTVIERGTDTEIVKEDRAPEIVEIDDREVETEIIVVTETGIEIKIGEEIVTGGGVALEIARIGIGTEMEKGRQKNGEVVIKSRVLRLCPME